MLKSKKHYHVKVKPGKYQGLEVRIEQECFFLWIFRFWDCIRKKECSTVNNVREYIEHLEVRFGKLDVIYVDNCLTPIKIAEKIES